jgi:drug/metabolite transporter (DMT)-like permease
MLSIALAFGSALAWGTGDFLGGIQTKRWPVQLVILGSAVGGVAFALAYALIDGQTIPPGHDLLLGSCAGVVGMVALVAFYQALAIGTMSIVAPISATGTAIPVVWGVANGEKLSALAFAAIVVTVAGVILASREQDASAAGEVSSADHRQSIIYSFVAAVGFGTVFILIAEAGSVSTAWPAVALKLTTFALMGLFVLALRRDVLADPPSGRMWLPIVVVGFFDVGANILYAAATQEGEVAIASVVASMFPITTVLLAHRILGERLAGSQRVGVLLALAGVIVLAAA